VRECHGPLAGVLKRQRRGSRLRHKGAGRVRPTPRHRRRHLDREGRRIIIAPGGARRRRGRVLEEARVVGR